MGATATAEDAAPEAVDPAPPAKRGKKGLIIGAAVLVLGIAGGAGFFFMRGDKAASADQGTAEAGESQGSEAAAEPKGTASYLPLQPAFVVNLADEEAARYLQIEMELMARDSKALDEAKNHMPRLRNALLLLLGSRRVSDLSTREGKEKLQADVTAEVRKVMTEATGKPQVEAVFFNSFVMQ